MGRCYTPRRLEAVRTRSVDRSKYRNYLLKSEEFLTTAREALERGRYNTCVLNAVHAIISAADVSISSGTRGSG